MNPRANILVAFLGLGLLAAGCGGDDGTVHFKFNFMSKGTCFPQNVAAINITVFSKTANTQRASVPYGEAFQGRWTDDGSMLDGKVPRAVGKVDFTYTSSRAEEVEAALTPFGKQCSHLDPKDLVKKLKSGTSNIVGINPGGLKAVNDAVVAGFRLHVSL